MIGFGYAGQDKEKCAGLQGGSGLQLCEERTIQGEVARMQSASGTGPSDRTKVVEVKRGRSTTLSRGATGQEGLIQGLIANFSGNLVSPFVAFDWLDWNGWRLDERL